MPKTIRNVYYKYLTFDDTDLLKEAKSNPKAFLEKYGTYLILDEIQRVKELFIEISFIIYIGQVL